MPPHTTENSCLARENPRNLRGLSAKHSGGGFASSPDVSACRLGPRIINSLHAGYRVESETSGARTVLNRRLKLFRVVVALAMFAGLTAALVDFRGALPRASGIGSPPRNSCRH